jgi:hypothetical protein
MVVLLYNLQMGALTDNSGKKFVAGCIYTPPVKSKPKATTLPEAEVPEVEKEKSSPEDEKAK